MLSTIIYGNYKRGLKNKIRKKTKSTCFWRAQRRFMCHSRWRYMARQGRTSRPEKAFSDHSVWRPTSSFNGYIAPILAFLPHSRVSTTFIIPITGALCLGYHGTISEPFGQSRNGIESIMDSFRHLYHLDHVSTLKEVSVLCLLFQSLLLLHTSPFSSSIKALDTL